MAFAGTWLDQLKGLSGRREAALNRYGVGPAPHRGTLERELNRIKVDEQAIWGMYGDLEVVVRNSLGAPRRVYHLADSPCGHAYRRGFRLVLEGQARARHLKRCSICRWPAAHELRVSA